MSLAITETKDKSTYIRFLNGLERIPIKEEWEAEDQPDYKFNYIDVLEECSFIANEKFNRQQLNKEVVWSETNCDHSHTIVNLNSIINQYHITPDSYRREGNDHYFKCVCGKNHLVNLAVFRVIDYTFIIGSECVLNIDTTSDDLSSRLKAKIESWQRKVKIFKNSGGEVQDCRGCDRGQQVPMRPGNKRRNYFCADCFPPKSDTIRCIECGDLYTRKETDFMGKTKWGTPYPKLKCRNCYFKNKLEFI